MVNPKALYQKVEDFLQPTQWLVSLLLVSIIIVSIYMLFNDDAVKRTAWTVYMYMP